MPPLFWLFLPYYLIINIFSLDWIALRGQKMVILRAKWDAIQGIPRMWRKRQEIQSHRRTTVMNIWRVLDKKLIPMRRVRNSRPL